MSVGSTIRSRLSLLVIMTTTTAIIHILLFVNNNGIEAKFTNQTVYQGKELKQPNYPSNVFFYKHLLHVTLDVLNGNVTGMNPGLIRYDEQGKVDKRITFPITCLDSYCNIQFSYMDIQLDTAYFVVIADACCSNVHYVIYTVDLNTFTYTASKTYNAMRDFPNAWLTYSKDITFTTRGKDSGITQISPLNLTSYTQGQYSTLPLDLSLFFGIGNPNSKSLIACGGNRIGYSYLILDLNNSNSISVSSNMSLQSGCEMTAWIKNSDSVALATHRSEDIGFVTLDIDQPLPAKLSTQTVYKGAYATNLLAQGSYAFIATRLWSNQGKSTVFQVDITTLPYKVIDEIDVPSPFIIFNNLVDIQGNGLDYEAQKIAQILRPPYSNEDAALLVTDFN